MWTYEDIKLTIKLWSERAFSVRLKRFLESSFVYLVLKYNKVVILCYALIKRKFNSSILKHIQYKLLFNISLIYT